MGRVKDIVIIGLLIIVGFQHILNKNKIKFQNILIGNLQSTIEHFNLIDSINLCLALHVKANLNRIDRSSNIIKEILFIVPDNVCISCLENQLRCFQQKKMINKLYKIITSFKNQQSIKIVL